MKKGQFIAEILEMMSVDLISANSVQIKKIILEITKRYLYV